MLSFSPSFPLSLCWVWWWWLEHGASLCNKDGGYGFRARLICRAAMVGISEGCCGKIGRLNKKKASGRRVENGWTCINRWTSRYVQQGLRIFSQFTRTSSFSYKFKWLFFFLFLIIAATRWKHNFVTIVTDYTHNTHRIEYLNPY